MTRILVFYLVSSLSLTSQALSNEGHSDPTMHELFWLIANKGISQGILLRTKHLVGAGEDVNFIFTYKSGSQNCILGEAIERQDYDLIKFLIDSGANVNPIYKKGVTPLGTAESYDREDSQRIIKLLIKNGANLKGPVSFPVKNDQYSSNTLISRLLKSRLIHDETKQYIVASFVEQGHKFEYFELPYLRYPQNADLIKLIVELQPEVLDLAFTEGAKKYKDSILESEHQAIRSILED